MTGSYSGGGSRQHRVSMIVDVTADTAKATQGLQQVAGAADQVSAAARRAQADLARTQAMAYGAARVGRPPGRGCPRGRGGRRVGRHRRRAGRSAEPAALVEWRAAPARWPGRPRGNGRRPCGQRVDQTRADTSIQDEALVGDSRPLPLGRDGRVGPRPRHPDDPTTGRVAGEYGHDVVLTGSPTRPTGCRRGRPAAGRARAAGSAAGATSTRPRSGRSRPVSTVTCAVTAKHEAAVRVGRHAASGPRYDGPVRGDGGRPAGPTRSGRPPSWGSRPRIETGEEQRQPVSPA